MNQKEIKKLNELETKASNCEPLNWEEISLRNELQFKRNKQNIYMRLTGTEKYYYAFQCYDFMQHILKSGWNQYKSEEIERIYIQDSPHYGASINAELKSSGVTVIKATNNKKELLGFIVGYNTARPIL